MGTSYPAASTLSTHVGFTGSRDGMTAAQKQRLAEVLLPFDCLHHGDCVGSDAEANGIAGKLGLRTEAHPPLCETLRAFCRSDIVHVPKGYHVRNYDIVTVTAELVAAPGDGAPSVGTWSTVRKAKAAGKPVTIIWPDGSIGH